MCRALVTKSFAFFLNWFTKSPTPLLNHTLPRGISPVRIMHEAYDMAQHNLDLKYLPGSTLLSSDFTGFMMTL